MFKKVLYDNAGYLSVMAGYEIGHKINIFNKTKLPLVFCYHLLILLDVS